MELDKKHSTSSDLQQLLTLRERVGALVSELEDEVTFKVDLLELEDAYRLVADVPGVAQSDLEISLQGRHLTIAGKVEPHDAGAHLLLDERSGGHLQRTIELPGEVAEKKSHAQMRDGLLILHLPKR